MLSELHTIKFSVFHQNTEKIYEGNILTDFDKLLEIHIEEEPGKIVLYTFNNTQELLLSLGFKHEEKKYTSIQKFIKKLFKI